MAMWQSALRTRGGLVDMFNKRKTLAIRYDDAVDTLDGD